MRSSIAMSLLCFSAFFNLCMLHCLPRNEQEGHFMSAQDNPSLEDVMHHRATAFQLPDPSTPDGEHIARRLHDEPFIWMTTVDAEGTPHPLPVGFLWDDAQSTLLIYSAPEGERDRLGHIRQNPRVSLHFGAVNDDIIVITGEAFVSSTDPTSDQHPAWVEKYQNFFSRLGMTMQRAAEAAPVPIRIRPLTLRYVRTPR
jgi:PPOX class probable F420-dependent enzyme